MKLNEALSRQIETDFQKEKVPVFICKPDMNMARWIYLFAQQNGTVAHSVMPIRHRSRRSACRTIDFIRSIRYAEAWEDQKPILYMDRLDEIEPELASELVNVAVTHALGGYPLPENLRIALMSGSDAVIENLDGTRLAVYRIHTERELWEEA